MPVQVRSEHRARRAAMGAVLWVAITAPAAQAQGLLDAPCTPGQKVIVPDYQGAPIPTNGRGHGMAAFLRGKDGGGVDHDYLMLIWSKDSGKGDGGISFYIGILPQAGKVFRYYARRSVDAKLREAHSTPVTNMFANDWRTWVLQATNGFSVDDLDSVATPSYWSFSNVFLVFRVPEPTDYSGGAVWFLAMAAPYLYVAEADQRASRSFKFTDLADPSKVSLQRQVPRPASSAIGSTRLWVRGNPPRGGGGARRTTASRSPDISAPDTLANKVTYGLTSTPPGPQRLWLDA